MAPLYSRGIIITGDSSESAAASASSIIIPIIATLIGLLIVLSLCRVAYRAHRGASAGFRPWPARGWNPETRQTQQAQAQQMVVQVRIQLELGVVTFLLAHVDPCANKNHITINNQTTAPAMGPTSIVDPPPPPPSFPPPAYTP
ncbi:hypothetical protein C8Q76DRAFT_861254 [Earliella scabrosa]|nr:hypothetical protein C8Q76DRAFT_861254 [Earliella scabrosa]